MAVLSIRIIGDPVLRTRAREVTDFGPELQKLILDMEETMNDVQGVGLAAPQVGVSLRVFTFRIDGDAGHVVNPELELSGEPAPETVEGCLSVPGIGYPAQRVENATVRGVDSMGRPVELVGTGMLARCFQHETDHLNGMLYLDRLNSDDRKAAMKAIRSPGFTSITGRTTAERSLSIGSSFGVQQASNSGSGAASSASRTRV